MSSLPLTKATPAVVIGLGVNGLGTVRSLARRGVPCIALSGGTGAPSEQTRYGTKVVLREIGNSAALIERLLRIAEPFESKSILFPSGDLSLEAISTHRDVLSAKYELPLPDHATVRLILDKRYFYEHAQNVGIPVARTYFPAAPDEITKIAAEISYPCLIKPAIAIPAWRDRGLKIIAAATPEDLVTKFHFAWSITQSLIVQEVTPGPDSALHFSLAYVNRDGDCQAMFTGRKLRQQIPHYGISSIAESLYNADVDRESRRIFKLLGYTGYGSVEFKRHATSGEMLVTEVTGRTWYPHAVSEYSGVNLPFIAYSDLVLHQRVDGPASFPEHVKWIDEVGDMKSALWYWKRGELTLGDWRKSYAGNRHWALAAPDDMGPFWALVRQFARDGAMYPARKAVRLLRKTFGGGNAA